MERSKRLLAVGGLWWAFVWSVPTVLAQTSSVQPPSLASQVTAALRPAAEPAPQDSVAAVSPASVKSPAATAPVANANPPAASPTASPSVAGVQTAAFTVRPIDHHDDTALGQRLFRQAIDGSRFDPFNWAVHVYKSRHRIELYYKNQLFKTYHAVFGRSRLDGGKVWEGDSRTPEGAYLIIAKRRSARFRWFLKLNYPNATDQARFAELRARHKIPSRSREGSLVGLHGTDSPILNIEDVNWTLGCISVDNADISEMAALLPVGTLVVINP